MPGAPEFIEYSKELPKDSTSQRAKAKNQTDSAATSRASKPGELASKVTSKVAQMQL